MNTCMLSENGKPVCWGADYHGITSPPDIMLRSLSVSADTACGITPEDKLRCWGSPLSILPNEDAGPKTTVEKFQSVSVARSHTCAIPKHGRNVQCWIPGRILERRDLNPPEGEYQEVKTLYQYGNGIKKALYYGICGLTYDGRIECLGNAFAGIERLSGEFVKMDVGPGAVCGIDIAGGLHCSADGDSKVTDVPHGSYTTVAVGRGQACALDPVLGTRQ